MHSKKNNTIPNPETKKEESPETGYFHYVLYAWGDNVKGQLGIGKPKPRVEMPEIVRAIPVQGGSIQI
jgi:hypothetical protein